MGHAMPPLGCHDCQCQDFFWFLQIFATSRARLMQSTASGSGGNSLITAFRQGRGPGITQWAIWREQWPMHCNELWGISRILWDIAELLWQHSGKDPYMHQSDWSQEMIIVIMEERSSIVLNNVHSQGACLNSPCATWNNTWKPFCYCHASTS